MTDFNKIYDVSSTERQILEWRTERRKTLREKYLKYKLHPDAPFEAYPFDKMRQRYITAQVCHDALFKPTIKNFLWTVSTSVVPMLILGYFVYNDRSAKEHAYRTGQVAYADRFSKFA